jgi:outer membrane phospholipase A
MRYILSCIALSLFLALPAAADTVLIAPTEPLVSGDVVQVTVLFTNGGEHMERVVVPSLVRYTLKSLSGSIEGIIELSQQEQAGSINLGAGDFVRHTYDMQVPDGWTGMGRLSLAILDDPTALVEIAAPRVQLASLAGPYSEALVLNPGETADADITNDDVVDSIMTAVDDVYEPDEDGPFGIHEPMYLVYGVNPDEVKFQISFKYRLFHNIKDSSSLKWLQNLHVGYTQLSFWDFDSASKPFRDSSYKPEFFYDIGDPSDPDGLMFPGLGLRHVRVGFLHESNGQDGLASRSLNYAYIQPEFIYDFDRPAEDCRECEWWELSVKPKVWRYVGSTSDNPTIDDFRGHAELSVRLMERNVRRQSGLGLMASLRKGDVQDKATLQIDATTPFPFVQKLFTPNLHAQFISGYSESLIGFDQKDTRFRIGLGTRW